MSITTTEIQKKMTKFIKGEHERLERMYEYYIGKHKIMHETKPEGKPNNRLITNFAKVIVNNTTGYFMGTPVTYNCDDDALAERIQDIAEYNDDAFVNMRLAEQLSIFGIGAELLYIEPDTSENEPLRVRYAAIKPMDLIVETDGTIENNITLAIRWYDIIDDDNQITRHIEVYDDKTISYYIQNGASGAIKEEKPAAAHYFGEVPVNVYYNNDYHMGDFEGVISLIDAYNTMQSESVNDYQAFADAYMLLRNMRMDETRMQTLREKHIIEAFEDADVSYLVKQVNDAYVENIKERIQKDIYLTSNTVNMSSDDFSGAASGAAIQRRMLEFENRVATTERYFKKGLQRRFELICNVLNLKGSYNYLDIKPVFNRNIPADILETADMVARLKGTVSDRTLLSQLNFIEDPDKELEQLRKEQDQYNMDNFGRDDMFRDDGTEEDTDDGSEEG